MTERATVFGQVARLYDRTRPTYPDALYDAVCAYGALRAGDRALEIGIGTGLATTGFLARGLEVVGVEPDPAMAEIARAKGITVVTAAFEQWTPDSTFDVVYAAQAWHWLDHSVAYERAADALRPGGTIALFWNRPQEFSGLLGRDIQEAYRRHAPALVDRSSSAWKLFQWADALDASERFTATERRTFRWMQRYSADAYTAMMQTHSDHLALSEAERVALHAAIRAVVVAHGGAVDVEYETVLYLARRS